MTFKKKYTVEDVLIKKSNSDFNNDSVIFISNLFSRTFCAEVVDYIVKNEKKIIDKYSFDSRGLVLESEDSGKLIKYFEYPFSYNRNLFGRFSESRIYKVAETLLNEDVFLFSMEIHSRISNGTPIPPHQDNAYYGLNNGKALTFYVPLNYQSPDLGGLRYCSNFFNKEYAHELSNEKGFSLVMRDKTIINKLDTLDPVFEAGDCTVHSSRSIHFANKAPSNIERGLVLRMSFFGIKDYQDPKHQKWYEEIVNKNRLANLKE